MARVKGITINTDASICPDTKAGGYAFWIKSDHFKDTFADSFKGNIISSDDGELKCIANALTQLLKYNLVNREFKYLYINTDSTAAISKINRGQGETETLIRSLIDQIKQKSQSITRHEVRHVKGHSNNTNSRSVVNRWCDENARVHMKKKKKRNQYTTAMKKLILLLILLLSCTVQSQKYVAEISQEASHQVGQPESSWVVVTRIQTFLVIGSVKQPVSLDYNEVIFCTEDEVEEFKKLYYEDAKKEKLEIMKRLTVYNQRN